MNRTGTRLGLAAVIAASVVLLIFLAAKSRREPVVRGVALSEWMEIENKNSEEYRAAIAEMDERCVRWLIRELDWSPTSMRTKLDGFMFRILRQPITPEALPDYRAAAAITLAKLGSQAQQAIPALRANAAMQVRSPRDEMAQSMAITALVLLGADSLDIWADKLLSPTNTNWESYALAGGFLHTNAAPVVPRLVHAYETTADDGIKARITMSLRLIRSNPALSVPVFRAALTNANSQTRFHALAGLLNFGPESKTAWDGVVSLLSDTNRSVRSIATNTLKQIDREAAQQLGIK